ncbi:19332_t:CDS:2 [Gigaspora margarita]|uniref:19332_t:CDS:1 n=1 Tax=Gigaspora margarita TaxID=4874 RepID=A0ABM8VWH2_GIGMA|nr:19332_t:CDS:2 [Gigaspora margarita]
MNKNKRNVEVDDSTEFGMKLLKLLKKSVISVSPDDPSSDDNKPKKINSSTHTKDEDEPTYTHSNNTISTTNSSPTPEYLSDPDAQQIQEEEATLQKIIVVLCSLGASLILVTIAIGILFWKVQKQRKLDQKPADNVPTNSNSQNEKDKDVDKDIDDGRDEPDDRPNIDVTVSINNEDDVNDNLNGTSYDKSTSFKAEFPHVNEESSLDTKKLEMSRSAVPSYPSYPSNQPLSILPSAPTVEELELHDASASNFSTDPPAYNERLTLLDDDLMVIGDVLEILKKNDVLIIYLLEGGVSFAFKLRFEKHSKGLEWASGSSDLNRNTLGK